MPLPQQQPVCHCHCQKCDNGWRDLDTSTHCDDTQAMPAKETKQSLTLLIFTINHCKVSPKTHLGRELIELGVMILLVIAVGFWVHDKNTTEQICSEMAGGGGGGYYPPSSVNQSKTSGTTQVGRHRSGKMIEI